MSDVETVTQELETASDGEVPKPGLGVIRDKIVQAMAYSLSGLARKVEFFYSGGVQPEGWKTDSGEEIEFHSSKNARVTYTTKGIEHFRFQPATDDNEQPRFSIEHPDSGRTVIYSGVQQFADAALQDIIAGRDTWEHAVGYLKRTHALLDEKMQAISGRDYDQVLPPTEPSSTE